MNINTSPHYVVVWDPINEYWEGAVVDGDKAHRLGERGVVTLSCLPDLFSMSGVGGYSRRSWGSGLPLDSLAPRMVAPLTLFCLERTRGLHWAGRLVPDNREGARAPTKPLLDGIVRFVSDSGQRTPTKAVYSEVENKFYQVRDLPPADRWGGWTIGGKGVISFPGEGHYGFSLYASAPGLRVAWVAATLATASP